jgi:hypothetical protein
LTLPNFFGKFISSPRKTRYGRREMAGWIREPKLRHDCSKPDVAALSCYTTGVWRCECYKLYVHRARWGFGSVSAPLVLTHPTWHRANLWEGARWYLSGFNSGTRLVRFGIFRFVRLWKNSVDRLRQPA